MKPPFGPAVLFRASWRPNVPLPPSSRGGRGWRTDGGVAESGPSYENIDDLLRIAYGTPGLRLAPEGGELSSPAH